MVPGFVEHTIRVPHGMFRPTKAFIADVEERSVYLERFVDKNGDVETRPVSRRAASRSYFMMGG